MVDELSPFVNGAKLWCFLSRPTVAFTSARHCGYERSCELVCMMEISSSIYERSSVLLRALVSSYACVQNGQKVSRALARVATSARGRDRK